MNEPLISIALCTYNGEKYIREQLDSIVNQTYQRLEIIIVDDASTDGTFDIVSSYATKDIRIKCYRNDSNLGFNKNFEKAITLTSGEYISISDQDDVWVPDKLQILLSNIQDNWLIFSNSAYVGGDRSGKLIRGVKVPLNYKAFLLRNYVTGHTALIQREFLNFALPFPDNGYYDWWMGFVAAYHHKITFCDEILTYYRVHGDSVIQKQLGAGKAEVEYHNITGMLNAFSTYKNLKPEDRVFIRALEDAYKLKASTPRSKPLIKLVYKNYHELFPNRKPWKSLTKLLFAFKYSKGLN